MERSVEGRANPGGREQSTRGGLRSDRRLRSSLAPPLRRITGSGRFRLNEGATESIFHAEKHTAKVIHLASHSFVHPPSPLYNTVLLAVGDSSASTDDGWLFLHEIQTDRGPSHRKGLSRKGPYRRGMRAAW